MSEQTDLAGMGIDEFDESASSRKGSSKKYKRINKDEFVQCLDSHKLDFEEVNYDWTKELVYEAHTPNGKFSIRIYSSIDKRTGEGRDKGSDAIRTVVVHNELQRPVLRKPRTNRTQNWCKNLKKKIDEIVDTPSAVPMCSECGSPMVIRKNKVKGTEFYGCAAYPQCENTRSKD